MSQRKTVKTHEAVYFKVWYFKLHVMIALLIQMPLIDDIIISLLWRILNALIEVESTITFVLVYPRKLDISYCHELPESFWAILVFLKDNIMYPVKTSLVLAILKGQKF